AVCSYLVIIAAIAGFWYGIGHPHYVKEPAIAPDHKLQCVSYAPFENDQSPFDFDNGLTISPTRIETDLAILSKRFNCIRTYSVTGLEALPGYAEKFGLKVLMGAWVSSDPVATRKELNKLIELAKQHPNAVQAVVVGNEALLRKEVTGQQLADYIRDVKKELPGVEVTYADVWEFWLKHPEVGPATDFVTIHILPYWEDQPIGVDDAMAHVKKIRSEIAKEIPGKDILIGETGWPSEGRMRENALPSRENQARFMRGFIQLAEAEQWRYNLIEAFDQPWKRVNEGAVGGFWGLYDKNRIDKGVFSGPVTNYADWQILLIQSVFIAALTLVIVRRHTPDSAKTWALLTFVIAAGAILISLQGHQFAIISRNPWEYLWAVVVLLFATSIYLIGINAIASGNTHTPEPLANAVAWLRNPSQPSPETMHGLLRLGIVFCGLVAVTGLVFDARYRAFNNFAFAIPAFTYLWAFRSNEEGLGRELEKFAAVFFVLGGVFILINETPKNLQADIWVLICWVLAYPLWKESHSSKIPALKTMLITGALAYAGVASVRYGIMESVELVGVCADKAVGGVCTVRSALGNIIHYQGFGWLSLIGVGIAIFMRKPVAAITALVLSIAGMTLYNASISAFAFVLALLSLILLNRKA
ncbi:MAG TPA: hypothetical protein VFM46_16800, partial [Pseudomonadales bacterium]|nr:hypothetical protein [Pseudomonadales bacterium]